MIVTKRTNAILFGILAGLSVLALTGIFIVEKNYYSPKAILLQNNSKVKDIVYYTANKNITELYRYTFDDKQKKLLYTDTDEEFKIRTITHYDPAGNSLIVVEARSNFNAERLTQIDLNNGKKSKITEPFDYAQAQTDATGHDYTVILPQDNSFRLLHKDPSDGLLKQMGVINHEPIIFLRDATGSTIVTKQPDESIMLYNGSDTQTLADTVLSRVSLAGTGIYFNRGTDIYKYSLQSREATKIETISQLASFVFSDGNCTLYASGSQEEPSFHLQCQNFRSDLDIDITGVLSLNYAS